MAIISDHVLQSQLNHLLHGIRHVADGDELNINIIHSIKDPVLEPTEDVSSLSSHVANDKDSFCSTVHFKFGIIQF